MLMAPVARLNAQESDSGVGDTILDTEINEILHKEFDPVFAAAGLDPKEVTIVIQAHVFNAAAASNQLLFIGTDLIEKTDNPNELIGVIAHETGHAAGYHTARRGDEEKAAMVPYILTLGLGLLAAVAGGGEAAGPLLSFRPLFRGAGRGGLFPRAGGPRRPGGDHLP